MRYAIYGNVLPGATVTVYEPGTPNLATIYAVPSGGSPVDHVTADANGNVVFYADDEQYPVVSYFDVKVEKAGYETRTVSGVWAFFSTVPNANILGWVRVEAAP